MIWLVLLIVIIPLILLMLVWLIKTWLSPNNETIIDMNHLNKIRQCAILSMMAYKNVNSSLIKILEDPSGYQNVKGYMFRQNNEIYIVFQGTANLSDLKTDIDTKLVEINQGVLVHEGFYKYFISIYPLILEQLDKYQNWNKIIITGHSLGGGLALLAQYHLMGKYDTQCITFGSPRVGNDKFAESFKNETNSVRVYNFEDPVPMVPINNQYQHPTSPALCIDFDMNYDIKSRDYIKAFRWLILYICSYWPQKFYPHYIENYISVLNRI